MNLKFMRTVSPLHASGLSSNNYYIGDSVTVAIKMVRVGVSDYVSIEWKNGKTSLVPMYNVSEFELVEVVNSEEGKDAEQAKRRGRPPKQWGTGDPTRI